MSKDPQLPANGCYGFCARCNTIHTLGVGNTIEYAQELMRTLIEYGRLDIDVGEAHADPALRLDRLFPGDRGHMFGVLECRDQSSNTIWLKAFSSLRGGIRFVQGWVPPNLSKADYDRVITPQEDKIKSISSRWEHTDDPDEKAYLAQQRAVRSKALWNEMKALYRFYNFAGEQATISHLFKSMGVPGGVGECCAPKLLCEAAQRGLTPLGLSEFYWGPTTTYDGKSAGQFYPCCEQRCRPLLGFILCGAQQTD